MATGLLSDASVGLKAEVTYNTPVVVDRFLEFTAAPFDYVKSVKQGQGLRVGSKMARSARRVIPTTAGTGEIDIELVSKGLGTLLNFAVGDATSTVVSGSTYQQVHTLESTVTQPSFTCQVCTVEAGGTIDPVTYAGCTIPSFELACPNGDILTGKFTVDACSSSTATAYATPSYAATPSLFHFGQGSLTLGGTLTPATTTVLASVAGGVATVNVREFSIKVDSKTAVDRYNLGGAGKKRQPTVGLREITGSMTIEYDQTTNRDAFLADTDLVFLADFDTGVALSVGDERLQIVLSNIRLEGEMPKANGPDLITQTVPFTAFYNLSQEPLQLVIRSADTAL